MKLYCNGTWDVRDHDVEKLEHAQKNMVWWMCNATMRDGPSRKELGRRSGTDSISEIMETSRLNWSCHVERKKENKRVKCVKNFDI